MVIGTNSKQARARPSANLRHAGRKRHGAVAALAMVIALSALVVGVDVATASAPCGDAITTNRWDGAHTGTSMYGAQAVIKEQPISLCSNQTGDSSGASAWVMIEAGVGSPDNEDEYAQIGFARMAGMGATLAFWEFNDGSDTGPGWARGFVGSISPNALRNYKVEYNFSTGKVGMYRSGTLIKSTPWVAESVWHPNWRGAFYGETWDRGDDVPGQAPVSQQVLFDQLKVKACHGCSYSQATIAGQVHDLVNIYRWQWHTGTSDTDFSIWTER